MNDNIKAKCDECSREFTIRKLDTKYHTGGIQEVGFKCPECKKRYTCFYTDGPIRNMQQELIKLMATKPKDGFHADKREER